MKRWIVFCLAVVAYSSIGGEESPAVLAHLQDHLSAAEIAAAEALPANIGYAFMFDAGFLTASACQAQIPTEDIFTPAGWINARKAAARGQYLSYSPSPDDTLRVLRIISKGCANGTAAGPVCDSVTRAVLLKDKGGSVAAEAVASWSTPITWQNGYGATASCTNLTSLFSMDDVARVRNPNGQFLIATFSGAQLLKIWTVKEKHLKQLGLR